MEPIASGDRGDQVTVRLGMGEYQMSPIYICPGAVRDRRVLYASSRLIKQETAGGRLTFTCAGVPGMFYRVAVRAESPPSAVAPTAPRTRSIRPGLDRRATLEEFQEGWHFDAKARLLLITYQDAGAAEGHTRLSVVWPNR